MQRLGLIFILLSNVAYGGVMSKLKGKGTRPPLLADEQTLIGGKIAPKDHYPEVIYIVSSGARCTATVVGPRTILTAAHCVRDGGSIEEKAMFVHDQEVFDAQCTHHPKYDQEGYSYDFALCKTNSEVRVKYASIDTQPPALGEAVTLMGYGCVNPRNQDGSGGGNGGNDGKLRYGNAKVVVLPGGGIGGGQYFHTTGSVALCFGDSGGPSMRKMSNPAAESHMVNGVNSRGNIRSRSLLSSTFLPGFQNWAKAWADNNRVSICGINRTCVSSQPPKPECKRERKRVRRYSSALDKWKGKLEQCENADAASAEWDLIITDEELQQ
jgi:hypothetical protein